MPVSPQSTLTLVCVLVTILLDMLGYGIILPVLPELIGQMTGGSVAQAAQACGYTDSHFTKVFRQRFGVAPSALRTITPAPPANPTPIPPTRMPMYRNSSTTRN